MRKTTIAPQRHSSFIYLLLFVFTAVGCGRQGDFTTIEITTSHRPPNLSAYIQDESQNITKKFVLSSSRIQEFEVDPANNQEKFIADFPVAN